jgi:hypothetical protein
MMKLRTFRAQKGQYRDVYRTIELNGWHVLRVSREYPDDSWIIRCANKQWFFGLPASEQRRIACAEAGPLRRLSDALPRREGIWNRCKRIMRSICFAKP